MMKRCSEDKPEFQDIYTTFNEKIRRYLTRLVGETEAEDLTHEVFVKAAKGLEDFRGESLLSTWIYKIATNTALDRLRSPDFKRSVQERPSTGEDEMAIEDKDIWTGNKVPLPDQQLIRREMNECIRSFIDGLPPDYRSVIVLGDLEEFKNHEIAEILGISLDAVKIRLHRARTRLRKQLETHCSFYRNEENEFACDLKGALIEFRKRQ
jgi:RNA polymerase sigma-70 factor, ECF subfamily